MPEITIQVQNLSKTFGNELVAVDDVSFEIPQGQTLAVIGPSGCGKTTTLKMLNRLIEPSSGTITILGRDVLSENPLHLRRQIGYVMQGGGLFPHWSARRSVGTVPTLLGWDSSRVNQRVNELMKLVGLELDEHGHRFPAELSGGQQQRVGIARALAADPPVILLDEPFSALDPVTRRQLQREFLSLKDKLHKTQVIVTHDLREAFLLGDQVLVMDKGRMMQCDTPERLKTDPANEFVSHFLQTELE